ncbi:MAG: FecR domain-containing protein [Acidobacteria bacterium]|nr:FecR domain-containing protein [Acidobacteriota bacterium]
MRLTTFSKRVALTATLVALAGSLVPLNAQDADDLQRGVARISLMNGDVTVQRGDSGDWVAGVINAPLMTGDRIASGPASRAEIQFDAANVARIGANAQVHLAELTYNRYQLELARGLMTFRVLRNTGANIEIDTPSVSVRPSQAGTARILVNDNGDTEVTARGGDLEIFSPSGSQWIHSGQTMLARGPASDPEFQVVSAGGLDDWDRWCESRDRLLTQSSSDRYVPQGVYGAEDLDQYGAWVSTPDYGYVWRPTVAADWTPYYDGRWTWLDWYGWSWVSYEPWGWAPYHYGRWFHNDRFGWCWYPGVMGVRHYWSPALVGWVGFGGGGGIGFGFGNVGWVPLAPYEVYHPWWGRNWYHSGGYFNRQINITNVNITNVYRNSRYNAVNGVGYRDFADGRFSRISRYNGSQIHNVGAIQGATPFAPSSQHLRFSDRAVANPPRTIENARFFRSQTPAPAQRVPFQQFARGGRQVSGQGSGGFQAARPEVRGGSNAAANPGGNAGGNSGGWRRFGQPVSPNAGGGADPAFRQQSAAPRSQQVAPRQQDRGGWQRFGSPGGASQAAPRGEQQAAPRQQNRGGFGQPQPRQEFMNQPGGNNYSAPNSGPSRQESLRVAPPVVRERPSYSAPRYSAPSAPRYSAPSYSAPRYSAPSAPRYSAPSYSAPRSSGGGGGGRPAGGGGGSHRGR